MSNEIDEITADFVTEAEESLEKIETLFIDLESKVYDKDILHSIFRNMHTIKGAAGFLGFQSIVDVSHKAETLLKKLRDKEMTISASLTDVILKSVDMLKLLLQHIKLKDGITEDTTPLLMLLDNAANQQLPDRHAQTVGAGESLSVQIEAKSQSSPHEKSTIEGDKEEALQTLRIDTARVDKVMDLTGEIVLVRNRLLNISNYLEEKYFDDPNIERLIGSVSFLDLVTSDMQIAVMKMRMQPLKKVFSKFPRLVRDLSNKHGKSVELHISGEDTEVDRSVIEQIGDPLVHIIRNAIDHGLEAAEERQRNNKPLKGALNIAAFQQGNQIIIEVSDDGKGIDIEKIKKKAVEKTLITEEEAMRMTEEAAINLIFLPGFSTVDVATELSGRGVGMDVVKTNIARLNGYVEVTTRKGIGTTFRFSIPLTLAIIQVLIVHAGGMQYAIPLSPIEETLKILKNEIATVSGQKVLVIREKVCPLFELSDITGIKNGALDSEYRYAVVVSIGDRKFCIAVDELLGQEEVVIKAIDGINTDLFYILGATISGDGKVVLILDLGGISRKTLEIDDSRRRTVKV